MKKVKKILGCSLAMMVLSTTLVYAQIPEWSTLSGNYGESVLLTEETQSEDTISETRRGIILSTGMLEISNNADGTLHINCDTSAHKKVDKIYQTVFLDEWNEEDEDWVQVGYWEFVRSKEEEEDEDLSFYHVGFTVTGCQVGRYYRARAMHLVELGDRMEGKATQTNGVLLTNN